MPVAQAAAPRILLDDWPLSFPVAPQIMAGRTMVPFRAIAEALGVTVVWEAESRSISGQGLGRTIRLYVDRPEALVDGAAVTLDVPPTILNGSTLVPLRFFSEAFGATVGWDGASNTVWIRSPVRQMEGLAFYAIRSYGEIAHIPDFSTVAFGWATLDADGTALIDGPTEYRWPEPDGDVSGERILEQAQALGVGRLLMVHRTDRDDALTRIVLDPQLRRDTAASIATLVQAHGFNGVLLDLEGLGLDEKGAELEAIRAGFTALVRQVAEQLPRSRFKLYVAVHPPNGAYRGYDLVGIASHADRLVLMAHDYVTVSDGVPEPPALVDEAIQRTLDLGVARSQVLLALNVYVETPESLAIKVGLAKRHGLAGLSVWRLGLIGPERMEAVQEGARFR